MATKSDDASKKYKQQTAPVPSLRVTSSISIPLKYICLGVLVVQTSANVLTLRYTRANRHPDEPVYIASTAVLLAEVLKILICTVILVRDAKYDFVLFAKRVSTEVTENWKDGIKLLVPALLYVVQNNLLYLALSNLDAATYQVTYQLKILTTALFSVGMLNRKLNGMKWLSLFVLMVGVIFVQWPTDGGKQTKKDGSSQFIGLFCVLAACISSGFSGVYFEKLLKGSTVSLWMRNLQLAFFSIIIAIVGVLFRDIQQIQNNGFFQGYNKLVFVVILLQGVGGLIIGAVVKYADNILKGFATSISIIVSSVISYYVLGDFQPTVMFVIGSSGVLMATYLYSLPASVAPPPTEEKK